MKRGIEARRKSREASARLPGHITYNASLYTRTENPSLYLSIIDSVGNP
jgi:hypothetical protein